MSSNNVRTKAVSVDEQGLEDATADPIADEPLRPTVEMATQAKVDANHPDGGLHGLTLEAEEKAMAREAEKARTRTRWDRRQHSDREARTRQIAAAGSRQRRDTFAERRAAVDPWADPDQPDPRESLTKDALAQVNEAARRIATNREGWTAAAVSRQIARHVGDGLDMTAAVVRVAEQVRTAPGTSIPIDAVGDIDRGTVSIAGEWADDWEPTHPAISQVGLLTDATGQIKVTIWTKSDQPRIDEGERVCLSNAKTSWYKGRVSVALTRRSQIGFPERDRWWDA